MELYCRPCDSYHQRRHQPQHISARREHDQSSLQARTDNPADRHILSHDQPLHQALAAATGKHVLLFNQFIKLVESNFRRERRVGWYAEQIDITPKYLSETIKKVSQRTPNEWIDNYVVLELRLMLKNSTKSIKQITDEMNFPNQSFLGKFFKEHVGLSPTEYRRGKL